MLFMNVRNAFNEVSRAAVFEALNESPGLRCLLPMFRAFYEETGTLWYDMGAELGAQAVESAEGTQQGDPGSGLAFALAIQGPLRRAAAAIGQTASPQTGLCVATSRTTCASRAPQTWWRPSSRSWRRTCAPRPASR